MKQTIMFVLVCSLMIPACSSNEFNLVKPVYPKVLSLNQTPNVDSLQPTLMWEDTEKDDCSYDLVIYEVIEKKSGLDVKKIVGKEVYYRKNLVSPEHRLEEALEADTEYCWSVRLRKGDKVTQWSRYGQFTFLGTGYTSKTNAYFTFRTPEDTAKE